MILVSTGVAGLPGAALEVSLPAWGVFAWYGVLAAGLIIMALVQRRNWLEIWQ
jgi:hypothetical protein